MATKLLNLINVPSDIGSIYAGKSRAPAAFHSAGLQSKLRAAGYEVNETSAFEASEATWSASSRSPNGARNEERTVDACHKVCDTVAAALESGGGGGGDGGSGGDQERPDFQLILSGECLYCPPILSAYWKHLNSSGGGGGGGEKSGGREKRVGMIYVDADCDLCTAAEPSASGVIAGMTLTHATLREGALESMKAFSRPDGSGVVDSSNIVFFGLNMASPVNKREHLGYLFDNHYRVVTAEAVQRAPVERAGEALRWLEERVDWIVVHLDVDVIDPRLFPLCNVPSYTGIGFEETMSAVKIFLRSEKTVALSVAEVNPDHDPGLEMTGRLVDEIVDGLSS